MLRPPKFLARRFRLVRTQDFVWLALFGVLIAWPRNGEAPEIVFLVALAVAQVLEPKIPAQPTTRTRLLWIAIKLALAFMLIGYTDSINSVYWPLLLLPVVSAATMFGVIGTTLCAALAGAASSGPRKRCGAPTAWPRWASFPRASPTSCATRSAPSRRRRKC
jgi:hypothetical protein